MIFVRGTRAVGRPAFVRNVRYSLLAAVNIHGILDYTIRRGAITGSAMLDWMIHLRFVLQRPPARNSVIVWDNASVHTYRPLMLLFEYLGVHVVRLPPYSPFLNIIEMLFNVVKSHVKRQRRWCRRNVLLCLVAIIEELKERGLDFAGALRHAGYGRFCRHRQ